MINSCESTQGKSAQRHCPVITLPMRTTVGHIVTRGSQAANEPLPQLDLKVSHHTTNSPQVLIVSYDLLDSSRISTLFEKRGYFVETQYGQTPCTAGNFSAVIYTARSASSMAAHLVSHQKFVLDLNWALIAREDIDNIHCVVRFSQKADAKLKAFVKRLSLLCHTT